MSANTPIGKADFTALVEMVKAAVAKAVKPMPLTLSQPEAQTYMGLSKSSWHRLKSADLLPRPIYLEGAGERYRTKDLDNWVERQKPRRK